MLICEVKNNRFLVLCDTENCNNKYESNNFNRLKGLNKYEKDLCRSCKQRHQYSSGIRTENWSKVNKRNLGKSFEEIYGKDKAIILKEKFSKNSKGENNGRWGLNKRTPNQILEQKEKAKIIGNRLRGKSFEETYGKKKAKEIKNKLSIANTGENNPMYGKPSPKGSGNGFSGWYKNFYFRSLLEFYFLFYLLENNIQFKTAERKEYRIKYTLNDINRTYIADFYLIESEELIEIKPLKLTKTLENLEKFKAAKKKYGIKFKVLTEKNINKIEYSLILKLIKDKELKFTETSYIKFKKYVEKQSK